MVSGASRALDRGDQIVGGCGRGSRRPVTVPVLIVSVLFRLVMRIPVRQPQAGA